MIRVCLHKDDLVLSLRNAFDSNNANITNFL